MKVNCKNCGKEIERAPSRLKYNENSFCSYSCRSSFNTKGEKNYFFGKKGNLSPNFGKHPPIYKGGVKMERGYVLIFSPDHPYQTNGYVREHRLVMEKKIGRFLLPEEIVHHMNHIKDDNRIENLMLIGSSSDHGKMHGRPKKIK